jgi:hypothetical protein
MTRAHGGRFTARLWRYPGKGGWHFFDVPKRRAPPVAHGWGHTPVEAIVGGHQWKASVWRSKDGRTQLPQRRHVATNVTVTP